VQIVPRLRHVNLNEILSADRAAIAARESE